MQAIFGLSTKHVEQDPHSKCNDSYDWSVSDFRVCGDNTVHQVSTTGTPRGGATVRDELECQVLDFLV